MRETEELIRHALDQLRTLEDFNRVRFVILFGSAAIGKARETSDLDLCFYYEGTRDEGEQFRFAALSELFDDRYDIQIFSNLPLYVRMEVLKGRVVSCPDESFLYDVALDTIREFDDYKHRLYDYLGTKVMA